MAEPEFVTEGPVLFSFESLTNEAPPGTTAAPRPPGHPRRSGDPALASETDVAFARELAERVLEYVRTQPAGLSADQIAALIQQFLPRRSAG